MNAWPRRVCLTFHGVEAGHSWNLIYDESRVTISVCYLLFVHPGFAFFGYKQLSTFKEAGENENSRVGKVCQLRLGSWVGCKDKSHLTGRQTADPDRGRLSLHRRNG